MEKVRLNTSDISIEIRKLYCKNTTICLSDFIYEYEGNQYKMVKNIKGDHGNWQIFKSNNTGEMYATDNVWNIKDDINEDTESVEHIQTITSKNEFDQLCETKKIRILNTFDFLSKEQLDEINECCKKSIIEHKQNIFISKNTTLLYNIYDDAFYYLKLWETRSYDDINKKIYKVENQYIEEDFDEYEKALEYFIETISYMINNRDDDILNLNHGRIRCDYLSLNEAKYDENFINNYFYSTKINNLDNTLINHLNYNGIILCQSKIINNKLNTFRNNVYDIHSEDIYLMSFTLFNKYMKNIHGMKLIEKMLDLKISNGEFLTIQVLKRIFPNKYFKKTCPKWLNNLELDLYNDDLNLAFEYQGKQHYEKVDYFHKSDDDLKKQKIRDSVKLELCKRNNVKLICIHYQYDTYEKIKEYIELSLKN